MKWNWQRNDWPNFSYKKEDLADFEALFQRQTGLFLGTLKYVNNEDRQTLTVDLMSSEALNTSEIEGEILNRDSVQSSIRRHFGLVSDTRRVPPAEQGIADMMFNLYRTFGKPLSHDQLFAWHKMLTKGRADLKDVGVYRTHSEPMQVVSGADYRQKIHFEAPPSSMMRREMNAFIKWFNDTSSDGSDSLPALTRAGIAHLYFVSIHPFEDGNGRIGRAIAEKTLSQACGQPTLIALSKTIQENKKSYYDHLEFNNKDVKIHDWLVYFAKTVLAAQNNAQQMVDFLIRKTKLYEKVRDDLKPRQSKVIYRIFREGPAGFKGGLSAENYISIAQTSRATATRDLQDLVDKGVLYKTGERRHTRYYLNLSG